MTCVMRDMVIRLSAPVRVSVARALLLVIFAIPATGMAAPGDILFSDNFESGTLVGKWTTSGGGNSGVGTQTANSGSRSMYTCCGQETVTSVVTDISAAPGVEFSVWIRRGNDTFSEDPDNNEDLTVEYRNNVGSWVSLETFVGDDAPGEIFSRNYALPASALSASFQLRFVQAAGNNGNWDYWHIDDVVVTETAAPVVSTGFCDDFESGLGNWTRSVASRAGISTQTFNSPGQSLYLRWDSVTVTSSLVDLQSPNGYVTAWIRRGDDSFSENPESNENLAVEYKNNVGAWVALDTLPGNGTPGETLEQSYTLPTDALHAGFQLRFSLAQGSGSDYDYWHVDDVCISRTPPPSNPPIAYYALDENAWTGTAGEIVDGSGSGNDGVRVGAADTLATGKVCRAGSIVNDGDAINSSVDVDSAVGSRGTVSFWFRPNWNQSGGERNQARVLFDASFGDKYFKLIKADNRNNTYPSNNARRRVALLFEDGADNDFVAYTSSEINFAANTWIHIAVTWDYPGDRFQIYIDGSLAADQAINTNGSIPDLDTLYFGDNRSGYNAYGVTTQADGSLDEIYLYSEVRSGTEIQTDMNATHPCAAAVDHIRIEHDGEGLTCDAETVTVRACVDANCTVEYSSPVTATLTPDGDTVTFTGNTTGRVRRSTIGVAALGAVTITPVPSNGVSCFVGAIQTCNMNFVDTGFRFTDGASPPNPITVGTQIAGKASNVNPSAQTIALQAVRTDTSTGACVGVFANGADVNVEMGSQCNNPTTCAGKNVRIFNNGNPAVPINNNPNTGVSSYTSVPLRFTTNSQAILSFDYVDVGQISLHARYNILDGAGTPTGNYMTGSSNQFVVKPAGFVVTNIKRPDDTNNPANTGPADTPYFVKAGTDFKATVEARDINNNVTPNYGNETTPEGVLLTPSLVGGLGLTNNPAITNGTIGGIEFGSTGAVNDADGVASVTNLAWPEVGIITLTPSVGGADGDNYLGAGVVTGTTTGNVGRFIPNDFAVSYNAPEFETACSAGNFTYVGQGFKYVTAAAIPPVDRRPVIIVTAKAAGAGTPTTQNYTGGWWKITSTSLTNKTYSVATGALDTGALPNPDPVITDSGGGSGELKFSTNGDLSFTRGAPVIPFDADISLAIDIADGDGVTYSSNPARFGQATPGNGIAFSNGKEMRWGRLNVATAQGSELVALPVPMTAQYYLSATSGFVTNTADTCTLLALTGIRLTSAVETVTADNAIRVKGGVTTQAAIANSPLVAGDAGFSLTAPGVGGDGYVDITPLLDPANLDMGWLRYDWDGDTVHDNDPTGRANFGVFSGSPRHIYWRRLF